MKTSALYLALLAVSSTTALPLEPVAANDLQEREPFLGLIFAGARMGIQAGAKAAAHKLKKKDEIIPISDLDERELDELELEEREPFLGLILAGARMGIHAGAKAAAHKLKRKDEITPFPELDSRDLEESELEEREPFLGLILAGARMGIQAGAKAAAHKLKKKDEIIPISDLDSRDLEESELEEREPFLGLILAGARMGIHAGAKAAAHKLKRKSEITPIDDLD